MADVTSSREPCAINPEFRFVDRRCAHRWEGRERMERKLGNWEGEKVLIFWGGVNGRGPSIVS